MDLQIPPKVTERAFARLAEINGADGEKALRVAVEGGGCSGFQYQITLDSPTAGDLVLTGLGQSVVIDEVGNLTYISRNMRTYLVEVHVKNNNGLLIKTIHGYAERVGREKIKDVAGLDLFVRQAVSMLSILA